MRKLLVLAVALSLGGCAAAVQRLEALSGASITQDQVDEARNSYDAVVLAPMRRYALLPRCKLGQTFVLDNCHDAKFLKQMRNIDSTVEINFGRVQSAMVNGNVSALQTAWQILNSAVSTAKSQITQNGIR